MMQHLPSTRTYLLSHLWLYTVQLAHNYNMCSDVYMSETWSVFIFLSSMSWYSLVWVTRDPGSPYVTWGVKSMQYTNKKAVCSLGWVPHTQFQWENIVVYLFRYVCFYWLVLLLLIAPYHTNDNLLQKQVCYTPLECLKLDCTWDRYVVLLWPSKPRLPYCIMCCLHEKLCVDY